MILDIVAITLASIEAILLMIYIGSFLVTMYRFLFTESKPMLEDTNSKVFIIALCLMLALAIPTAVVGVFAISY